MILTGAQGSVHTQKKEMVVLLDPPAILFTCTTLYHFGFFAHMMSLWDSHIRVYDALYLHFGCWLELSQIQTDCWLLVLQFFYMNTRISVMHTLLKKALHDFVRKGGELTAHASSKKTPWRKEGELPKKKKDKRKKEKAISWRINFHEIFLFISVV